VFNYNCLCIYGNFSSICYADKHNNNNNNNINLVLNTLLCKNVNFIKLCYLSGERKFNFMEEVLVMNSSHFYILDDIFRSFH